ncbi:MAG: metallopeptidase family protein, partial [Dysgonamonadaceae bacterium]|nr:metallopeptidase family protein [Dysgonamonadaceae bacterium]
EKNNNFEFDIINNTQDTLFLFDSYIFDRDRSFYDSTAIQQSIYLHRYDKKTKQCKLSFLPLLPYLSANYTGLLVLGGNKVAHTGQVLYHFRAIPPDSKNTVTISKCAFYSKDYVKEVYPQKISKFEHNIKFRKSKHKKCDSVVVEFALYKNIDLLISERAYWSDEYNFNEQALSYIILPVSVDIFTEVDGESVSYGNGIGTRPNGDGTGDEFGSANGWRIDINPANIAKGIEKGFKAEQLVKSTYVHEVGHLLGLDDRYTDKGGVNKGWEGNIMGESRTGKVEQRNIDGILKDAMKAYDKWIQNPKNEGKEFRYEINNSNMDK